MMRRSHRGKAVAACIVVAAVAVGELRAPMPVIAATSGVGPVVAVIGDSYVSGEGLIDAAGLCGRSAGAWGDTVAAAVDAREVRVAACSGATVADLVQGGRLAEIGQLESVRATQAPELLLLLIGGNDLGFTELVGDCLGFVDLQAAPTADVLSAASWTALVDGESSSAGCTASADDLRARVDNLAAPDRFELPNGATGGLAELYAVAADVVAPGGSLVVVGYPQLFAPPAAWPARYGLRCHGLHARDADAIRTTSLALDVLQAAEVDRAASMVDGVTLSFVSVQAAFASPAGVNHGLCGDGDAYLNGLTVVEGGVDVAALLVQLSAGGGVDLSLLGGRPGGSFHPNANGHAAYATAVLQALQRPERS